MFSTYFWELTLMGFIKNAKTTKVEMLWMCKCAISKDREKIKQFKCTTPSSVNFHFDRSGMTRSIYTCAVVKDLWKNMSKNSVS